MLLGQHRLKRLLHHAPWLRGSFGDHHGDAAGSRLSLQRTYAPAYVEAEKVEGHKRKPTKHGRIHNKAGCADIMMRPQPPNPKVGNRYCPRQQAAQVEHALL
jgi:hypothetical protein